jgi:hypothetical protein
MMDAVDGGVLHQMSDLPSSVLAAAERELYDAIEILVAQARQELTDENFHSLPLLKERSLGWVVRGHQRRTAFSAAAATEPAPFRTQHVNHRVPNRAVTAGDIFRELFRRELRDDVKDLAIRPVAVIEEVLKIFDRHGESFSSSYTCLLSKIMMVTPACAKLARSAAVA